MNKALTSTDQTKRKIGGELPVLLAKGKKTKRRHRKGGTCRKKNRGGKEERSGKIDGEQEGLLLRGEEGASARRHKKASLL